MPFLLARAQSQMSDTCIRVPVWFGVVAWLAFLLWYALTQVVAVYAHRLCTLERYYGQMRRAFVFSLSSAAAVPLVVHAVALTIAYVGAWLLYYGATGCVPTSCAVALTAYALHLVGALAWPSLLFNGRQRFLAALMATLSLLALLLALVAAGVYAFGAATATAMAVVGFVLWVPYMVWSLCVMISLWLVQSRNRALPHRYLSAGESTQAIGAPWTALVDVEAGFRDHSSNGAAAASTTAAMRRAPPPRPVDTLTSSSAPTVATAAAASGGGGGNKSRRRAAQKTAVVSAALSPSAASTSVMRAQSERQLAAAAAAAAAASAISNSEPPLTLIFDDDDDA
jgi:hypothetical protein